MEMQREEMKWLLFAEWAESYNVLREMALTSLDIDVKNCYCTNTCCRLVEPLLPDVVLMAPWQKADSKWM